MANNTLPDIALDSSWTELTAAQAGLVNATAAIQNVGTAHVAVVYGGAAAPVNRSGIVLKHTDTTTGVAANVWARAIGAAGRISVTTL